MRSESRKRPKGWFGRVARPGTAALCAAVLGWSVVDVSSDPTYRSAVAEFMGRAGPPSALLPSVSGLTVVLYPDRPVVIDPAMIVDPGSEGDFWSDLSARGIPTYGVSYSSRRSKSGWYAATRYDIQHQILMNGSPLVHPDRERVRAALIDFFEGGSDTYRAFAAQLREFEGTRSIPRPLGLVHNAVAGLAAVLLVFSLPSVYSAGRRAWVEARHRRRIGLGRCASCGYSVAGLRAAATCPECGHALGFIEEDVSGDEQ